MILTLQEQKQIINLINKYNSTDKSIIQSKIIKYINDSGYKNKAIAEFLGITGHTIYGWRKVEKFNKPSFEIALKLMDLLELPITELIKN